MKKGKNFPAVGIDASKKRRVSAKKAKAVREILCSMKKKLKSMKNNKNKVYRLDGL